MIKYESFNENKPILAGKYGFRIFLDIVNDNDIDWTKKNYLNTGEYLYFFRSEHIIDNQSIAEQLEYKKSLKTAYLTLKTILNKRLCFYFGVKNDKLEYGFYDETKFTVYKIGIFEINNLYLKKQFPKKPNLSLIKNSFVDANLKTLSLLHQIKMDLGNFWSNIDSDTKILNDTTVRRAIPVEYFKEEDRSLSVMIDALSYNIKDFEWNDSVHSYAEITEKNVYFFVKLI